MYFDIYFIEAETISNCLYYSGQDKIYDILQTKLLTFYRQYSDLIFMYKNCYILIQIKYFSEIVPEVLIDTLSPGRCIKSVKKQQHFKWIFSSAYLKYFLLNCNGIDTNDIKSILVQVMSWCHQATSHYLNHIWPISLSPYGMCT